MTSKSWASARARASSGTSSVTCSAVPYSSRRTHCSCSAGRCASSTLSGDWSLGWLDGLEGELHNPERGRKTTHQGSRLRLAQTLELTSDGGVVDWSARQRSNKQRNSNPSLPVSSFVVVRRQSSMAVMARHPHDMTSDIIQGFVEQPGVLNSRPLTPT